MSPLALARGASVALGWLSRFNFCHPIVRTLYWLCYGPAVVCVEQETKSFITIIGSHLPLWRIEMAKVVAGLSQLILSAKKLKTNLNEHILVLDLQLLLRKEIRKKDFNNYCLSGKLMVFTIWVILVKRDSCLTTELMHFCFKDCK